MNFKKHLYNKTRKNSFITLIIRLIGVAILFGLSTLMTRNVDEVFVGSYEFARVVLLTIATFGLLGTEQSILYFSGKLDAKNQLNQLQSVYLKMLKIIWVCSIIVIIAYFIIPTSFLLSLGLKPDLLNVIKKCILIVPFYSTTILNTEVIRAYNKVIIAEWFRNIFKYIPIITGTILIIFNFVKVDTLLDWYLYGFVLLAVLSFVYLQILTKKIHYKTSSNITSKEIIKTSYPMAISSFYTYLLMTIDVFLLAQFFNLNYIAYYAIAMKIMSVLSMVIISVNINYAPKIALNYENNDINALKVNLKEAARTIAFINLIIGAILLLGGTFFLTIFGENYTEALPAYRILIATQMVISLFGMVPMYMNMTGKQQIFHKIMGLSVVVNLISNLVLIPKYNMIGAALSYSITVLFWNILVVYFSFKTDKIHLALWK